MNRCRHVILVPLLVAAVFLQTDSLAAQESDPIAEDSATARALEELTAAYDTLAGLLGQGSDAAVEGIQGDVENVGDWEYRVVLLADLSAESIESELNALGDERWEVFWVEPAGREIRFFLKRPAVSYLSRVPLSTLLRMLGGMP